MMNLARILAVAAFVLTSLPVLAQQPAQQQPNSSATTASPAQTQQPAQANPTSETTASAQLIPVNGELVDKLDTKTAKTGDTVVIKTRSNVKTADGTEIPKGSKLIGRVTAVKQSGDTHDNSQVALQFDQAELKGGQKLPIHSEIQSLSPSGSESANAAPESMGPMPGSPTAGGSAPNGMSSPAGPATAPMAPQAPQSQTSSAPTSASPAAGTIVARTGNIAIRTTSIPGVLLANNEPGQQDPRMAKSSGILLGPKHDIHLDGGTKVVVGVAATGAGNSGGN
jgi:hypothetical protein